MAKKAFNKYITIRYIIDAPVICIAYLLALHLSNQQSFFKSLLHNYLFAGIALLIWYIAASFSRLYADRRSNKFSEEIIFIIYSLILYTILLSSASFFLRHYFEFKGFFFTAFTGSLFILLSLTKYIIRKYVHAAIYQGEVFDNVLIIGSGAAAHEFYETINKYYYYGYKCIGFVDNQNTRLNGCNYLGKTSDLSDVLSTHRVDEVIISLPTDENNLIQECIDICDYYSVKTRIIPDLHQYVSASIQVNNIGLLSVINIRTLSLDKFENKILKRTFDIVFSLLFFLILGWWLLPLIALIIRINSKGPVIFKQERWGLNNKKILCYKFRTMVADSRDVDEEGRYLQASPNDARITSIGAFLRKTNLDELPQFWNVLLGNMSVVGPRPHPTPLNIESMHTVDNYMLRHIVTPGITGWAQVNGCRGETKTTGVMQKRINFDLYYIHRWTFWLDCQIILQTMINILRGDQNAY